MGVAHETALSQLFYIFGLWDEPDAGGEEMNYGYIRKSTDKQDEQVQVGEIEAYAQRMGVKIDKIFAETKNGRVPYEHRVLGKIMEIMKPGDHLICVDLSRISRRFIELFMLLWVMLGKGFGLVTIRDNFVLRDRIETWCLAFALGLVAEIERMLLSMRTRAGIARKKGRKLTYGIEGNVFQASPLCRHELDVLEQLANDWSMKKIADHYKVSIHGLKTFINDAMGGLLDDRWILAGMEAGGIMHNSTDPRAVKLRKYVESRGALAAQARTGSDGFLLPKEKLVYRARAMLGLERAAEAEQRKAAEKIAESLIAEPTTTAAKSIKRKIVKMGTGRRGGCTKEELRMLRLNAEKPKWVWHCMPCKGDNPADRVQPATSANFDVLMSLSNPVNIGREAANEEVTQEVCKNNAGPLADMKPRRRGRPRKEAAGAAGAKGNLPVPVRQADPVRIRNEAVRVAMRDALDYLAIYTVQIVELLRLGAGCNDIATIFLVPEGFVEEFVRNELNLALSRKAALIAAGYANVPGRLLSGNPERGMRVRARLRPELE